MITRSEKPLQQIKTTCYNDSSMYVPLIKAFSATHYQDTLQLVTKCKIVSQPVALFTSALRSLLGLGCATPLLSALACPIRCSDGGVIIILLFRLLPIATAKLGDSARRYTRRAILLGLTVPSLTCK